jgi:peptidoglycan/LPS O-acetylase OafA/YrhL
MVFGLLPNNQLSVIGVSWTLGVIFLFYMLFPYFVFLLKNRRRAWVAFICSIILNVLCAVYFFSEKFVIENFAPRHSFLYCTPFFLSGGLIYLYREEICRVVQRFRWMFLAGCCVLTCLYYVLPDVAYSVDCTAWKVLVVYSAWICYAISIDSRLLCNAVSKFMGKISFEMYLAQMLVFRLVEKLGIVKAFGDSGIGFFGIWLLVLAGLTAFVELYRWLIKILELRYEHKRQQEKY